MRLSLSVIATLLALLPIARMAIIVSTTGANTVSNDYVLYLSMVDHMLDGTYDWRNYFADTFIGGSHVFAFPFLIRLLIIRTTSWNIYAELYVILAAAVLKLFFLWGALGHWGRGALRLALLPACAALVFSTSQINVFTYGDAGLSTQLDQLGLALGIWALVRFQDRFLAVVLMALGGVMATFSGGGGPAVWPAFLVGLVLLGYRKRTSYAVWVCAAALASLPYVVFGLLHASPWPHILVLLGMPHGHSVSWRMVPFMGMLLGMPFAQHFAAGEIGASGALAAVLGTVGLGVLWKKRSSLWVMQAAPALMLITYSVMVAALIGQSRSYLESWYPGYFMNFWVGLLGLAYTFWVNRDGSRATRLWPFAVIYAITFLYLRSNITYADKASFLYVRAPVSAACLRNYRVAPTFCEQYLSQWGLGRQSIFLSELPRMLEKHHLSVFAPHQEWTLQGDFVLDTVHPSRSGRANIFWSQDLSPIPTPWYDYRHLNLFLRASNAIAWTIHLPANVTHATFSTAVAVDGDSGVQRASGLLPEIFLDQPGAPRRLLFARQFAEHKPEWHPVTLPLTGHAGKTITLQLGTGTNGRQNTGWVMYRYPVIDLQEDPGKPSGSEPTHRFVPGWTAHDMRFDLGDQRQWHAHGLERVRRGAGAAPAWTVGAGPSLTYERRSNLCLQDYSYLSLRAAASPHLWPRAILVAFQIRASTAVSQSAVLPFPLFADGRMHDYSYDLKLLELPPGARLTALRLALVPLAPFSAAAPPTQRQVQIADLRLIRSTRSAACDQP